MQTERYVPHLGPEMWEGWEAAFERAKRDVRSWLEGQTDLMRGEGAKTLEPHLVLRGGRTQHSSGWQTRSRQGSWWWGGAVMEGWGPEW